jgi:biopolymer transport protein ExbD
MLVLIIMLIITIPVQLHAVNLAMPAGAPPTAPPVVVTVDIDFDGTVIWNGDTLPDRAALEARLRAVAAQRDQPEVHVRPNKLVEYKSVAMVLAAAQRLGVTRLGMVGNEQYAR